MMKHKRAGPNLSSLLVKSNNQNKQLNKQIALLRSNESLLMSLLNASNEAIIFVDKDIVIEAAQLFYNYTGYSKEEVIGHSIFEFFTKDFQRTVAEVDTFSRNALPVLLLCKDGVCLPVEMITNKIKYKNKHILAMSFINLDLFKHFFSEKQVLKILENKTKLKNMNEEIYKLKTINNKLHQQIQYHTLQAANFNDFILHLLKCFNRILITLPKENEICRKEVLKCIYQIKKHINGGLWEEFKLRFAEVHPGFYDKLLIDFPALTENDLKLCAFIKLNMTSNEIAELINLSANSVKVARNRLRKKLQIDGKETLLNFLATY